MNRLKRIWEHLVGKPNEETLEARIFHAVCILSVLTLAFSVLFNYVLGLILLSQIMLVVSILVLLFYYYSRFRAKTTITLIFYGLLSNLVFIINYYYNSGIDGPTILIFLASLFLIVTVSPPRQFWFWVSFNLIIVFTLLFLQYRNEYSILYSYPDVLSRFTDLYVSYAIIILLIFSITKYIRHNYSLEKNAVESKAAELEITNDTKNKLLSIIAHDLRSPLDSIQSYLELLSFSALTPLEKQYIEKDLLEKTRHTGHMLSNLLSWTRAQMEGVKVNLREIDLTGSLNDTIELQQTIALEKGIIITNNLNNQTTLIADENMLQLVVRNLLNNAIKFTSVGGQISISDSIMNDRGVIAISDNGLGIPYDRQRDILSLKSKSTYGTQKEKGFGLGLVMCKEFTEIQNGNIWFESTEFKGTTFYINFQSNAPKNNSNH